MKKQRASGVRIIDRNSKQTEEFFAKVIFLNASTLGTTFILLNSVSNRFPNGFGNDSDVIGHYLMDHHFGVGVRASHDGFKDKYYHGRRPIGIYVPRYANLPGREQHKDFVRGYGYQGSCYREGWGRTMGKTGIGAALKNDLQQPGEWRISLGSWGEQLPDFDNKVSLNTNKTDQWGLPILKIDAEFKENELAMRQDMMKTAAEMVEAAGFKDIEPYDNLATTPPGHCIHEMGTCRMGKDSKTSALNKWNQMWAAKNVFVTDGACMTSSALSKSFFDIYGVVGEGSGFCGEGIEEGGFIVFKLYSMPEITEIFYPKKRKDWRKLAAKKSPEKNRNMAAPF